MVSIEVRNLSKVYAGQVGSAEQPHVALQGVNLEVGAGEFVCLLGPSGCGKTTLLNILSGLDTDYSGSVQFSSQQKPVMSYMFQEPRLLPWLTVAGNLRFVLDSKPSETFIEDWLARVGLSGFGAYYPSQLSVGMQQRVAVARALIMDPELLFMDEPFSSLDELTAFHMREELLELWAAQRCTVVFVTHNPLEAVYLADRVLMMTPSPGRVTETLRLDTRFPRPRSAEDTRLWDISRDVVRKLRAEDAATLS